MTSKRNGRPTERRNRPYLSFKMLQQHSHDDVRGHTKPHNSVNTLVLKISVTPNPLQNLTSYAEPLPKTISTQDS